MQPYLGSLFSRRFILMLPKPPFTRGITASVPPVTVVSGSFYSTHTPRAKAASISPTCTASSDREATSGPTAQIGACLHAYSVFKVSLGVPIGNAPRFVLRGPLLGCLLAKRIPIRWILSYYSHGEACNNRAERKRRVSPCRCRCHVATSFGL